MKETHLFASFIMKKDYIINGLWLAILIVSYHKSKCKDSNPDLVFLTFQARGSEK
jgi:hypothetical protein